MPPCTTHQVSQDTVILLGNRLESNLHARASLFLEREKARTKHTQVVQEGGGGTQKPRAVARGSAGLDRHSTVMSAWRRDGRFPIPSKYCEGVTVGLLAVLDTVILLGNRLESNLHARASLFLERYSRCEGFNKRLGRTSRNPRGP